MQFRNYDFAKLQKLLHTVDSSQDHLQENLMFNKVITDVAEEIRYGAIVFEPRPYSEFCEEYTLLGKIVYIFVNLPWLAILYAPLFVYCAFQLPAKVVHMGQDQALGLGISGGFALYLFMLSVSKIASCKPFSRKD